MSVRKRTWQNADGSQGEAWVVAYTDFAGKRRIRSFEKKREADAYHASVGTDLRSGIHVPDSQSVTVAEAGRLWLEGCELDELERSTLDYYRQHLERHIVPLIGAVKLSRLTVPMVRAGARLARCALNRRTGAWPCRAERGAGAACSPPTRQGRAQRCTSEQQTSGRRRHPVAG